jgi:hypothetical protein
LGSVGGLLSDLIRGLDWEAEAYVELPDFKFELAIEGGKAFVE